MRDMIKEGFIDAYEKKQRLIELTVTKNVLLKCFVSINLEL